jgi:hypothetical protein
MLGDGHHNAMSRSLIHAIVLVLIGTIAAGCASSTPSVEASRRAASFEEFAGGICSAFESMFKAVGNPDTGEGSDLSDRLEAAAEAGDLATAEQLARQISSELETGRTFAAFAGGWAPGGPTSEHVDRLLVAFEAWSSAQVEAARLGLDAAHAQDAFEAAGGVEAWQGTFQAIQAMASERPPVEPYQCPTVPMSL